jgi:FHS family glucose/mannose:H+ symporter-like MFS transporter
MAESKALYALSLYVLGMAVMRIFIGGIFRRTSQDLIVKISFFLLLTGCLFLWLSRDDVVAILGLIAIGAGLAAGFPIMLGFIGNKFAELSGTAFSIVLTIALIGNMLVNFLMGVVAETFGIHHLPTMALGLTVIMIMLFIILRKKSTL